MPYIVYGVQYIIYDIGSIICDTYDILRFVLNYIIIIDYDYVVIIITITIFFMTDIDIGRYFSDYYSLPPTSPQRLVASRAALPPRHAGMRQQGKTDTSQVAKFNKSN